MNTEINYISEIFPLEYSNLKLSGFRLSPEIKTEIGNRLSWNFSKKFPNVVVVWERPNFYILAKPKVNIPSHKEWKEVLEEIQDKLKEEIGNINYFIQWIKEPSVTPSVIAKLAVRIINLHCRLSYSKDISDNENLADKKIKVKRYSKVGSEIFELNNNPYPAITLTAKSQFLYSDDLEQFFLNHPDRNDPEKLLVGLKVITKENNSNAEIIGLNGTIGEHRERLLKQATGAVSIEKIKTALPEQPVVTVRFGKKPQGYDYPMAALQPRINDRTANKFKINYGELQKESLIDYPERLELIVKWKKDIDPVLSGYNIKFKKNSLHSKAYPDLFWTPENKLEETKLLFGKGVTSQKSKTLIGLTKGGVYRRHEEFKNSARKIRLAILKLCNSPVGKFRRELQARFKKYGFDTLFPEENNSENRDRIILSLDDLSSAEIKAQVEQTIDKITEVTPDLVLVFLPESDRQQEDSNGESLYCLIQSLLLRRTNPIATQVIYENTLNKKHKDIINQIAPGILAKLGNLPFILAESLNVADYIIGLDVSRRAKNNKPGSDNACASVRIYGEKGDFLKYQLTDSLIQGEEISEKILHELLPSKILSNKTTLIYRDGLFRGNEIKHILEWEKAIKAKFILVECYKSGNPRLYNFSNQNSQQSTNNKKEKPKTNLQQPTRGLALKLSSTEAILVTTQVSSKIGTPQPIRLKIRKEGLFLPIDRLLDITLKLTLLHHGSLKDPRLPIPLFGADRIAYRRLQGIYPGILQGNKQYWL